MFVPGTDRVLMFNPTFDINQSVLNAMNKEDRFNGCLPTY